MKNKLRTKRTVVAAAVSLVLTTGTWSLMLVPAESQAAGKSQKTRSCTSLEQEWLSKPADSPARKSLETVMFSNGCDTDRDGLLSIWETSIYGTNPDVADTDGDLLLDGPEVLTHLTDPLDPDTDGDSLLDGWEVNGHPNGTALPGANPRRADIYVEMDYMVRESAVNGLAWNASVLAGIENVFANAPIQNPDGSSGISIHLEPGNEVPYDDDLRPYEAEFAAIRDANFDPARRPVYHYMIWANAYGGGTSSGVSMGIPAADFLVTLGLWHGGEGGTDEEKIGTFIHELGHNLGLRHGGDDHVNYKPNYLSVMNYFFQVSGVPGPTGPVFDYQRYDLPALNEAALDEVKGLDAGPEWFGYSTLYYCSFVRRVAPTLNMIDWNCDGVVAGVVSVDTNNDFTRSVLGTQNNWANIVFDGGGIIGSGASASTLRTLSRTLERRYQEEQHEPELTWEQHQQLISQP